MYSFSLAWTLQLVQSDIALLNYCEKILLLIITEVGLQRRDQ